MELANWLPATITKIVDATAGLSPENVNEIGLITPARLTKVLVRAFKAASTTDQLVDIAADTVDQLPGLFKNTVWSSVYARPNIRQKIASLILKALLEI